MYPTKPPHLCTHSPPYFLSVHFTWLEFPTSQDPLLTWMSENENSSFLQSLGLPPGITDYDRFGWFYKVRLSPSFLPSYHLQSALVFFVLSIVHALWFLTGFALLCVLFLTRKNMRNSIFLLCRANVQSTAVPRVTVPRVTRLCIDVVPLNNYLETIHVTEMEQHRYTDA